MVEGRGPDQWAARDLFLKTATQVFKNISRCGPIQPQRGSIIQLWVARPELPWEQDPTFLNPEGGCIIQSVFQKGSRRRKEADSPAPSGQTVHLLTSLATDLRTFKTRSQAVIPAQAMKPRTDFYTNPAATVSIQ